MILVCVFLVRESALGGWLEGPLYSVQEDRVAFDVSRNRKGSGMSADLLFGCHE